MFDFLKREKKVSVLSEPQITDAVYNKVTHTVYPEIQIIPTGDQFAYELRLIDYKTSEVKEIRTGTRSTGALAKAEACKQRDKYLQRFTRN